MNKMRKRFNVKWLWFLLLAVIASFCILYWFILNELSEAFEKSLQDVTPEEIFKEYVWNKADLIPTEVNNINGVEGIIPYSSTGPAFVRFNASQRFIDDLVKTKFSWYEAYSPVPCRFMFNNLNQQLMKDFPERFMWWHPEEIISPMCYKAQGTQGDDFRYLLIGLKEGTVYFYQNASCGVCPD